MKKKILLTFTFLLFIFFNIQSQTFTQIPDDNFEQALIDLGYDDVMDDTVLTANIENIKILDLNEKFISSLEGIEDFALLEELYCDDSYMTSIDFSKNPNLKVLFMRQNYLESITLTENSALERLDLTMNFIQSIDLKNNTKLEYLHLHTNKLSTLDISNNSSISNFNVLNNPNLNCIAVADVSVAQSQSEWYIDELTSYSTDCSMVSEETTYVPDDNFEQALIDLGYDDILDNYVVTDNIKTITSLNVERNEISNLEGIEDFVELKILMAPVNNLMDIDLSQNINLEIISLQWNNLTDINLPLGTKLTELTIDNNPQLGSLDVSNHINLEVLHVKNTNLSILNLINNPNLEALGCGFNNIKVLDLSKNEKLKGLGVPNNHLLSELDLSNNIELTVLNTHRAAIKSLDLSANVNLTSIEADHMSALTSLNIKNGENTKLNRLFAFDNDNLSCIQVDDVSLAESNSEWIKRDNTIYSEDCSYIWSDLDQDGVANDLDLCPDTRAGAIVDATGCEASIADLVLENILIGIGSDQCAEEPSCYITMSSLKDFPINIIIETSNQDAVFEGILNQSNPIALNDLAEGDYNIIVPGNGFSPIDFVWNVSFTSDINEIGTTVGITKPDQTYSIGVSGSTSYEVNVNGIITSIEFDTADEQLLEIPLVVGLNQITVNGSIECDSTKIVEEEEDDSGKGIGMLLFPTLSNGLITIENTKEKQIHGITITGLNGIQTKYILINDSPKEMKIDMSGVAKGMYVVRIQQASGEAILRKILIQ